MSPQYPRSASPRALRASSLRHVHNRAVCSKAACGRRCNIAIPSQPSTSPPSASVSVQYAARVAAGKIERDSAQQRIVDRLAKLETELAEQRLARKSSSLGWLFGSRERVPIKGLYMFGEVGRGKTMLMDLFFA